MKTTDKIDAARIDLVLGELRLPGIKLIWAALAATADKEGWPAARFLAALAEQELVERSRRRFERHLEEARLPPGKTLDTFDFTASAYDLEGAGAGARRRRRLARKGSQSFVLRAARPGNPISRRRSVWP